LHYLEDIIYSIKKEYHSKYIKKKKERRGDGKEWNKSYNVAEMPALGAGMSPVSCVNLILY
jgi:hypothetical protein